MNALAMVPRERLVAAGLLATSCAGVLWVRSQRLEVEVGVSQRQQQLAQLERIVATAAPKGVRAPAEEHESTAMAGLFEALGLAWESSPRGTFLAFSRSPAQRESR